MTQGQEELPSLKAKVPGSAPHPKPERAGANRKPPCAPQNRGSLKVVHQVIL